MAELGIMIFAAGGTALQLSSSGARNRWQRCGFVSLVDFTGVENFCASCEISNAEKCAKIANTVDFTAKNRKSTAKYLIPLLWLKKLR